MPRVALYTERGKCRGYPWITLILFVLDEEFICLIGAVVEVSNLPHVGAFALATSKGLSAITVTIAG